jgi:hypothetical protein
MIMLLSVGIGDAGSAKGLSVAVGRGVGGAVNEGTGDGIRVAEGVIPVAIACGSRDEKTSNAGTGVAVGETTGVKLSETD